MKRIKNIEDLFDIIEDKTQIGVFRYKNKTIQIGISGGTPYERVKRVQERREEKGLCIKCGKRKPKKGLRSCKNCLLKGKEYRLKIKND